MVGSLIWLSGDTKAIEETLKNFGLNLQVKKKQWYYGEMKAKNPKPKSMNEIKRQIWV